ncbi:olfactory receptor class A-like protein 1 [Polypterus senegalus]|uniref:olfactory receptor class A-like protein 1 n=1 Tax=Polypterus senegalus TaxID=55291 RepID=UPI00196436B0|nr:olfactory receptor class A-like protein 1 [Polypterus senegalus]
MDRGPAVKAAGFLVLTVISIPANLAVCSAFLCSFFAEGKLTTADIILCHLALVNLLVAFVRSIPQTLAAFGYQNLFDDLGCKLSLLCFRILRGLSISLTCLLSTYQAILIAPASSKLLAPLKHRIPKYLPHIFLCLYVFCSITSVHTILYAVSKLVNNTIPPYTFNLDYCFVRYTDYSAYLGTGLSNFWKDFVFIVLMTVMSFYIVILLYKHGKKVKSIRSSDRGSVGARAETKASRAVVTLVILYVIFFGVDNAIWLYSLTIVRVAPLLSDLRVFFSSLYTSVCPMVVIITNPKVKAKIKMTRTTKLSHSAPNTSSSV